MYKYSPLDGHRFSQKPECGDLLDVRQFSITSVAFRLGMIIYQAFLNFFEGFFINLDSKNLMYIHRTYD